MPTSDRPLLVISGTNRPGANARRVADRLVHHYSAAGVAHELFSLAELPAVAFAPETYAEKPPEIVAVRERVENAAGLHVVTPEYNGGFPGVLKYFIDLLKFPESFEDKPVAFVGEAAGQWGALRPVEQLQQLFAYRNAHLFPERVFIPKVNDAFDGDVLSDEYDDRLRKQCDGFAVFVRRFEK